MLFAGGICPKLSKIGLQLSNARRSLVTHSYGKFPSEWAKKEYEKQLHLDKHWNLWYLAMAVMVPLTVASGFWTYYQEYEHWHHPRPEFIPYEHLIQHTQNLPWRDGWEPFFYNRYRDPVAGEGYRAPDPATGR